MPRQWRDTTKYENKANQRVTMSLIFELNGNGPLKGFYTLGQDGIIQYLFGKLDVFGHDGSYGHL